MLGAAIEFADRLTNDTFPSKRQARVQQFVRSILLPGLSLQAKDPTQDQYL